MKLFRSLLLVGFSVVGILCAMNIETGKEFSKGYVPRKKHSSQMENMPRISGCEDLVNQAATKLQELSVMIQQKRNFMATAKFGNKEDLDDFRANAIKQIKDRLQEVKSLINDAEKETHVAL